MPNYKPGMPFNVPMKILKPEVKKVQGVTKKSFSDPETSELFYGSFRTFGGTENLSNDVYTVIDTAIIDTWYRPDIKADCKIYLCDSGAEYEIISDPENINMRNQYLQFKVRKVGGRP